MKRFLSLMSAGVVLSASLWASSASGQTTTTVPDTTTVLDTTTTVPDTTTIAPDPTTTVDPGPTTTVPIILPGEHVTAGSITLGTTFKNAVESNCSLTGALDGQNMNIVKDETGKIGAVYGKATLGGGDAGLVMIELGPLPMAIAAFRTTGGCNQDVVGIGSYAATATTSKLSAIGYGLYPNDFATNVSVDLNVVSSEAPGSLDLQSAYDFLAAPRPTTTTIP